MTIDNPISAELPIEAEERAQDQLPPSAAARSTYHAYLQEGMTRAEALQLTLDLWRELYADARPSGYKGN